MEKPTRRRAGPFKLSVGRMITSSIKLPWLALLLSLPAPSIATAGEKGPLPSIIPERGRPLCFHRRFGFGYQGRHPHIIAPEIDLRLRRCDPDFPWDEEDGEPPVPPSYCVVIEPIKNIEELGGEVRNRAEGNCDRDGNGWTCVLHTGSGELSIQPHPKGIEVRDHGWRFSHIPDAGFRSKPHAYILHPLTPEECSNHPGTLADEDFDGRACATSDPERCAHLGDYFVSLQNRADAQVQHEHACEAGVGSSCHWLAENSHFYFYQPERRALLEKACAAGHSEACVDLANVLRRSDPVRARETMAKACNAGSIDGCFFHAFWLVREGKKAEARALLRKTCEARLAAGCWALGELLLAEGERKEGIRFKDRACSLGYPVGFCVDYGCCWDGSKPPGRDR